MTTIHLPDLPSWWPAVAASGSTLTAYLLRPDPRLLAFLGGLFRLIPKGSPMDLTKALSYTRGLIALGCLAVELAGDQADESLDAAGKLAKEAAAIEAKGAPVLEAFGVPADLAAELTAAPVVSLAADAVALGEQIAALLKKPIVVAPQ